MVPLSCGDGRGVLELPAAARWTQCKALKRAGAHQPVLSATRRHYRRERAKAAADWYAHGVSWRRWVRCDVLPDWRPLSRAGCGGKADGCGRIGDGGWLVSAPRSRAVLPSWPTTAGSSPSVTLLATSGGLLQNRYVLCFADSLGTPGGSHRPRRSSPVNFAAEAWHAV